VDDHPPQPWRLTGQASVSGWVLPSAVLPAVPPGVRPVVVSPVGVRAKPVVARSAWRVEPDGPLGFPHGRSPAFSLLARDFRMGFGR
jgi:hypothetical protein